MPANAIDFVQPASDKTFGKTKVKILTTTDSAFVCLCMFGGRYFFLGGVADSEGGIGIFVAGGGERRWRADSDYCEPRTHDHVSFFRGSGIIHGNVLSLKGRSINSL